MVEVPARGGALIARAAAVNMAGSSTHTAPCGVSVRHSLLVLLACGAVAHTAASRTARQFTFREYVHPEPKATDCINGIRVVRTLFPTACQCVDATCDRCSMDTAIPGAPCFVRRHIGT